MSTKSQQYNSPYLLQLLNITFQYKSEFQFFSFENVSKLLSLHILVIANVDIHDIASTIQNYENRTATAIFDNSNSVQSTVTNNKWKMSCYNLFITYLTITEIN
jgi:hypothetical protein